MRNLILALTLGTLTGCGSLLEPGGGLEATNVTYDENGFHADHIKLHGIGQDRQVAFYKDTGINPETGEAYSTTDASYGSTVEPGIRGRMDDNDRYVAVAKSIEQGVDNSIQRAISLAGLATGVPGLGGGGESLAGSLAGLTAMDLLSLEPTARDAVLALLGAPTPPTSGPTPTELEQDPTVRAILEQLQDVTERLDAMAAPVPVPTPDPDPDPGT